MEECTYLKKQEGLRTVKNPWQFRPEGTAQTPDLKASCPKAGLKSSTKITSGIHPGALRRQTSACHRLRLNTESAGQPRQDLFLFQSTYCGFSREYAVC